jgi:hypothetical protein
MSFCIPVFYKRFIKKENINRFVRGTCRGKPEFCWFVRFLSKLLPFFMIIVLKLLVYFLQVFTSLSRYFTRINKLSNFLWKKTSAPNYMCSFQRQKKLLLACLCLRIPKLAFNSFMCFMLSFRIFLPSPLHSFHFFYSEYK